VEQVVRSEAQKAASQAQAPAKKALVPRPQRRPGRPPGRTHNTTTPRTLPPALVRLPARMETLRRRRRQRGPRTALVLDGPWGHPNARPRTRQGAVPRMAPLRCEAALSVPDTGPAAGRGPPRHSGRQRAAATRPGPSLTATTVAGHLQPWRSHMPLRPKACTQALHVVRSATTTLRPQARAHGVLCSRAVALASAPLVDSERVRGPIALHVCDAQPSWGLEEGMPLTPPGVPKAAPLAWCMVTVAYRLRADVRQHPPASRLLAWTADGRGSQDVEETAIPG
jgi:hypothetical protein